MTNRYIGLRFGKLTVLSIADDKLYTVKDKTRKVKRYNVMCDCGTQTIVFGQDLRSGKTQSCNSGICKLQYQDRSIPAFNAIVKGYKDSAAQRSLVFELTHNEIAVLTKQECYYCGAMPQLTRKIKSGKHISEYTYNGIDRIDNTIGYTANNVVTACDQCNHAKHIMSQSEFIELARKIAAKHTPNLDRQGP